MADIGGDPFGQGFGLVEGEDGAPAGLGLEQVGEAGFDAGGFVAERQRAARGREGVGQSDAVFAGLWFDAGQGRTSFLASITPTA